MSIASEEKAKPMLPWTRLFVFVAWLVLTVHFFNPPREAYDHSLDRSNYATYLHFAANTVQWGETVLPMTGPYGFVLYGSTYSGELFWVRLIADFALKGVFVALILHLFGQAARGAWRWVWLLGIVWLVPVVDDLFHDYAILAAALCLIFNLTPQFNRWMAFPTVTLGLLALFKGTHFVTTGLCFAAVLLLCAHRRDWRQLGRLIALYLGSIISFWMLAGQNPANIPLYLRGVVELSSGYNATMGLDELPVIWLAGITGAALLAGAFLWTAFVAVNSVRSLIVLLLLAGFSFIKWKHGFLRADGHVTIFFAAAAVIALTVGFALFSPLGDAATKTVAAWRRYMASALFTANIAWGALATFSFNLELTLGHLASVPSQFVRHGRFLLDPLATRAQLDRALELNRREAHVPQIQNEIGNETVDFFGYEQGLLLLNDFNYRPRPMGGGAFNVFTPWLQERNERFIRDPRRAPRWQVMRLLTLDERLPAADDGLALRAIIQAYTPVLMQRDYLLLHRRAAPQFEEPKFIETKPVRAGTPIAVPEAGENRIILVSVEAPMTLYGKLRTFLYRPPALHCRLVTARQPFGREFVLKPTMMRRPVILSPLLSDNTDVIDLFGREAGNVVKSLELRPAPGFDQENLRVSFHSIARPPPPEDGDITELKTYVKYPLHNREPDIVDSLETGIRELNKEPVTSLHAPGSLTWNLKPDDQQFLFSYGLLPQTYLDGGTTDGVEFAVELIWPNDGRVLFKHMLRPRRHEKDRGMQRARIFLPPFEEGAQLRLSTHPGQDKDAHFDQSYVTRIQIKSGPLVPEQFNGLGVVPVGGKLPAGSVAGIGGRPVYLIHAPDEVAIPAVEGAKEISCEIGLLPTAYEKGGSSDGVEFTVTAILPGGARKEIGTRFVNPRDIPRDRGPQRWTLDLPELPTGTTISISTSVGPNGNRSWDQSYVADVKFR